MRRAQLCLTQQLLRCSLGAPLAAGAQTTLPRTVACLARHSSSATASSSAEAAAAATPVGAPSRGFSAGAAAAVAPAAQKAASPKPWEVDGVFVSELEEPSGRQVFRLHAPYTPRERTPLIQGSQLGMVVPVWRLDGAPTDRSVILNGDVFDSPIRPDLVARVVRWQLAKRRQGTHGSKDRAQVSGTGKKPWAQKGTGRARAGSMRAPQFRGGGAVHGPHYRSHAFDLPRKVRRAGLVSALSAKLAEGQLVVVEGAAPEAKTRALLGSLRSLCVARGVAVEEHEPSMLIVDGTAEGEGKGGESLRRAAANLERVHVLPQQGLNVYSILQQRTLVLTEASLAELVERLTRPIKR